MKRKRRLDADASIEEARKLFAKGRTDAARALALRVLEAKPDHPHAHRLAAAIDLADERYEPVLEHLALAGSDHDPWVHFAKARALAGLGRYTEAHAAMVRSRDLDPSDARVYELEAVIHRAMGDPKGALEALDGALALEPHRATALAMKADVLLLLERDDDALEAFRAAVRSRDGGAAMERAALLDRFAIVLEQRGNIEEATAARELAKALRAP